MSRIIILLLVAFISDFSFTQKPFCGVLEYKASLELPDSLKQFEKSWGVKIYTNDTITRIETETDQLGLQTYIRNIAKNKAYLLLELEGKKFAIQTHLNSSDTIKDRGYTVKKKMGSKKIAGLKCKKYWVQDKNTTGFYCYFTKSISNKYLMVYPEVPFLAVDYYIPTNDGLIHYELVSIKRELVDRNLFGVPSDYEKITFEEFIHHYYSKDGQLEPEK